MKTQLNDLLTYRFASAPLFSPDGKAVAYICYRASADRKGYDSIVRVICPKTGAALPMRAPQGVTSMTWMPDGSLLAALTEGDSTRLYAATAQSCTLFAKLPFKARLDCVVSGERAVVRSTRPITAEKAAEDGHYTVLDEFPFWHNGRGYVSKLRSQVFAVSRNGEPVLISPADLDVELVSYDSETGVLGFSGEMVTETMRPDWHQVYTWNSHTGEIIARIAHRELYVYHLAMLGGDPIVCGVSADTQWTGVPDILRISKDGSVSVFASPHMYIDNSTVSDVRYGGGVTLLARDGAVYFVVTEEFAAQLYRADADGSFTRLTTGMGSVDGFDVHKGEIVFTGLRDMRMIELYRLQDGQEIQLTQLNPGVQAPVADELSFVNEEGVEVYGLVMKPDVPADQKCPALLFIHGGPSGAFAHIFHHELRLICDMGYYVLCCNPTGSDGRGEAFGHIEGRWGTVDYNDLMTFTDEAVKAYPQIDPEHIACSGGSYGGFMVNWIIGHTDRFCCAISDRSISNGPSKEATGDNGLHFGRVSMKASVYTDPDKIWANSPLKYAMNVKTPTLFVHGEVDYRCHVSQGMMMYTAIRDQGVDARFALFKGESHELCRSGKPCNRLRRLVENINWLEKYCR